jgi:hypothetical protein
MTNLLRKLLFALMLLASTLGFAQNYSTDPGTQSAIEEVDTSNLNYRLTIPIVTKNGPIPFSAGFVFDNNIWRVGTARDGTSFWSPSSVNSPTVQVFGWTSESGIQFGRWVVKRASDCGKNSNGTYASRFYGYLDSQGVNHPIPNAPGEVGVIMDTYINYGGPACTPHQTYSALMTDGSGLTVHLSTSVRSTLTGSNGSTITPSDGTSASIADLNGNTVVESLIGTYTDSVGVQELVLGTAQINCPIGYNTFTYPTSTGTASVTVNCVPYIVHTNFGCPYISDANSPDQISLVDNIVLGDGSAYHFTYESQIAGTVTGRLASITYPNGAVTSFLYTGANNGINCADGTAAGLNVTAAAGTSTYTRDATCFKTTVVSPAPAANKTVFIFVQQTSGPQVILPVQTQRYQGASTLPQTTTYCYNGNQTNCATATAPTFPVTQRDTYSTLSGMSSKRHTIFEDSYGNVTEEDFYDYGASSPSFKAVASNFGYTWNGSTTSPNCTTSIGNGIVDRPCLVRMQTGSGSTFRTYYRQYSGTGQVLKTAALVGSGEPGGFPSTGVPGRRKTRERGCDIPGPNDQGANKGTRSQIQNRQEHN